MENVNLLAVLAAAVASMLIGALWYGPLFGRRWMNLMNINHETLMEGFNPLKNYGVTFLLYLVSAFVLEHIIHAFGVSSGVSGMTQGMETGFWCWLGFALISGWQTVAYENRKFGLFLLNSGYNLVCLIASGAMLGAW